MGFHSLSYPSRFPCRRSSSPPAVSRAATYAHGLVVLLCLGSLLPEAVEAQLPTELHVEVRSAALVLQNAEWRYFKGSAEPSVGDLTWTTSSFDDSAWERGRGGFGYGDQDEATTLEDMFQGYSTVYIRTRFTVKDPAALTEVVLNIDFDDGFVAYLNGEEVARANAPGTPGEPLPHDTLAVAGHEGGTPMLFRIRNAAALLAPGDNVISVQGLNESLASSDFSLAPTLASGAVVGEGCPGTVYVSGTQLLLEGAVPVEETRHLRLNDIELPYDPATGEFHEPIEIAGDEAILVLEALRSDLSVVASGTLDVRKVSSVGGATTQGTTFDASGSPYFLEGTLAVPAGHTLTVGPGVEFIMGEAAQILVEGRLRAVGTEEEPVVFRPQLCVDHWLGIDLERTRKDNEFVWCEISGVSARAAIYARSSKLSLDSCLITQIDGEGIFAPSSDIQVRNSEISQTDEAVSADGCRPAVFEYNHIHHLSESSDCLDPNDCHPAIIRYCLLEHTPDDGIDTDSGSVVAVGNEIRHCGDQGMSLVGEGNSLVEFNLIHHNRYGVALKNSQRATLRYNTIVDNTDAGIRLYEKTPDRGGGHAVVENSIVYFNGEPHTVDDESTISYTYCDVDLDSPPPGDGNIDEDPLFVDRTAWDYRLAELSPCIGAGEGGSDLGAFPFSDRPFPPENLLAIGTTPTSVDLVWIDVSPNEEGFELHRQAPGQDGHTLLVTLPAGTESFSDTMLAAGEAYSYRLRAFNAGGHSDWSNEVSQQTGTFPRAAGNLTATAITDHSVSLAWRDNSEGEDGFEVFRLDSGEESFNLIATVPADTEEYTDEDPPLQDGEEYAYRVRAYNTHGVSGWSNEVSTATLLLAPPRDVSVREAGSDWIRISWQAGDDGDCEIERRTGTGDYRHLATLSGDNTTYLDEELAADREYRYRLRTIRDSVESGWSETARGRTGEPPEAPGNLQVAATGRDYVALAWEDRSTDELYFEVQRRAESGDAWLSAGTVETDTTTFTDAGLPSGTGFHYRVRAWSVFGPSATSGEAFGETVSDGTVLFVRGDANADGGVDISDAVFLLLHLFSGRDAPPCKKSADIDDNGLLQITDAIRLLEHLFQGGLPPESPFLACGVDSASDALSCVSYPPCVGE